MEELETIKELLKADFYVEGAYISFYWKDTEICNIRQLSGQIWELYFHETRIYLDSKEECLDYLLKKLQEKVKKDEL